MEINTNIQVTQLSPILIHIIKYLFAIVSLFTADYEYETRLRLFLANISMSSDQPNATCITCQTTLEI